MSQIHAYAIVNRRTGKMAVNMNGRPLIYSRLSAARKEAKAIFGGSIYYLFEIKKVSIHEWGTMKEVKL